MSQAVDELQGEQEDGTSINAKDRYRINLSIPLLATDSVLAYFLSDNQRNIKASTSSFPIYLPRKTIVYRHLYFGQELQQAMETVSTLCCNNAHIFSYN